MDPGGDRETARLRPFLEAVRSRYPDAKVILFGSRARGDHLKTSDFDLVVVSSAFKGIPFRERLVETYKLMGPCVDADIICLTPEEYRRRSKELGIVGEVAREGKLL